MSQANVEWPVIRGAVIVFSVAVLITACMIGASLYFKQQVYAEFIRNKSMFQSISQRYLSVDQEENMIQEYYPQYVELLEEGVIGREQRLNWIEVLRAYGEDRKLPMLQYEISSQDEYTFDYPLQLGKFKIYNSRMKLNLKLLHEGDLVNLLRTIDNEALGLNSVNNCEITRSQRETLFDIKKPNIEASCEINWLTIKKSDGEELST